MQKKNTHIPILDSLRAIAALSVCIYHFVCGPVNFVTNKSVIGFFTFGAYAHTDTMKMVAILLGIVIIISSYLCYLMIEKHPSDYHLGKT